MLNVEKENGLIEDNIQTFPEGIEESNTKPHRFPGVLTEIRNLVL
jgi:hypothetical protein